MKKLIALLLAAALIVAFAAGCASKPSAGTADEPTTAPATEPTAEPSTEPEPEPSEEPGYVCPLPDGEYKAAFNTDSSMFHVTEANNGLGDLTVKDGQMVIHISLVSKSIQNLYVGLAEDAKKDGAVLLQPTVDVVTYSDGLSDEVHGFDVPVPYLDEEFDLAIIGTKGVWYDHKVSVSTPET